MAYTPTKELKHLFLWSHCNLKFAFSLHLMKNVLGITNELSLALQKKDQDIVNAMTFVQVSKQRLQMMRDGE